MSPIRLFLVCTTMLLCMACGGAEQVKKESVSLAELEPILKVTFPPGTEVAGMMKAEERDRLIRLKVTVPAGAVDEFLDHSPIDRADLTDKRRFFLGPDEGWWDPSKPASLPTAQGRLENGSVVNIGIDQSGSDKATIYIVWHET